MESVIPCEPNGSGDSLLSSTDPQQVIDYRDFCYKTLDVGLDRAEMATTPHEEVEVVSLCGESSRGGSEIQPNEAPGSPSLKKGRPPR